MSALSRHLAIGAATACAVCVALAASVPSARAADDLPYVYIPPINVDVDIGFGRSRPPRYYDPQSVYAGIPPGHYEREIDRPTVAPDQVAAMLRSTGFSFLGPLIRRGWVYTAAVLNPRGDDGRIIIDARTGAIIRFLPAFAIDGRTERELTTLYGPPGAGLPPRSPEIYRAPPPPGMAPKVASRTSSSASSSTPLPHARPMAKAIAPAAETKPAATPPQQSASAQSKPAEAGASEAAKPAEARPAETKAATSKPAEVELKPTQEMPPMQTLE